MEAGLLVVNDTSNIQIDSTYKNQTASAIIKAPSSPYGNFIKLPDGLNVHLESPAIWCRTTGFLGGVRIDHTPNGSQANLVYYSEAPVDFVIASTYLNPADEGFGLQVNNGLAVEVYNSAFKYPRIIAMPAFNGNAVQGSATVANNVAGTFFCANLLPWCLAVPMGGGSSISYPPWILTARLSGNTMSYKMIDSGSISPDSPLAGDTILSPYRGITFRIPVAIIPGT